MTDSLHVSLVRRYYEDVLCGKNIDLMDELFEETASLTNQIMCIQPRSALKEFVTNFVRPLTNSTCTFQVENESADQISLVYTYKAINSSNGQQFATDGRSTFTFKNGKIAAFVASPKGEDVLAMIKEAGKKLEIADRLAKS